MNMGEDHMVIPALYSRFGRDVVEPMKSEVVYIHPEKRFFTVEYTSPVTGEKFRESFYFTGR